MKRVFFDTNIYNHLDQNGIKLVNALKNKGFIEILTIPQILGELAETFETDLEKAKFLCCIYSEVISGKVIKNPPDLLANELYYILTGKKILQVDLSPEGKKDFFAILQRLKNGALNEDTLKFIKYAKENKDKHFEHSREDKKRLDLLWNSENRKQFPDFESFWLKAFDTGDIRRSIKDYLGKMIEKGHIRFEALRNISGVAKKIENKLDKLPHFTTALKIIPAMCYRYHIQKEKVKRGDLEDTTNLIATSTLDIYVSDDLGAREIFSLIFPEKLSLSLTDFLVLSF